MRLPLLPLALLIIVATACAKPPTIYPGREISGWPAVAGERAVKIERPNEESANYRSYDVLIPRGETDDIATNIRYLENKQPGKKRLVVILPIYGSTWFPEYPSMVLAARLTNLDEGAGFNVAVIREKGDLFDWEALARAENAKELYYLLHESAKRIRQAATEAQNVVTWAASEPFVDANRIGIAGFSLGAMVATIAMGTDMRISIGAFAMGGGDPHQIFAYSDADFIKSVRENALNRFGLTRDVFRQLVANALAPVNPNRFAANIPPEKVLIVDAKFDKFMPQSSRDSFWRAFHQPPRVPLRITLPHDHKTAFLSMTPIFRNYTDRNIAAFFLKNL